MNIVQLVFAETGTYDPMMMRPYETIDSPRHLNTLQQVTRFGSNVSSEALSGCVGDILRPSADHLGEVQIASGWGQRRFRFFMRTEDVDLLGNVREQMITGYTNYDGANFATGSIDPNMRMYVSSSIHLSSMNFMTDYGRQTSSSISSASHVFNHGQHVGMEHVGQSAVNLQRPMDVFTTLQMNDFQRMRGTANVMDPRTTFLQERVKMSSRTNALAPTYFSKVLKAGGSSFVNSDDYESSATMWGKAEGLVKEQVYGQDEGLFELTRKTSFQENDSFTYGELFQLCPHLDHVTKLAPQAVVQQQHSQMHNTPMLQAYTAGTYDGWNGQNVETVWATILSNSLPPLMLDCMIANAGFRIHNHTLNGELDIHWFYTQPFGRNMDINVSKQLVDNFGYRMIAQVMRDLLGGNNIPFQIVCHVDVLGESSFEIGLGGQHPIPFATPSFADSLFSPVLTRGQDRVRKLAGHLEYFTENIMHSDLGNGAKPQTTPFQSPILTSQGNPYHASAESL